MTANEMRNLFKELYDGASAQEMGFDDIEVSRFLNLAKDIILSQKIFTFRNAQMEGFENSSKRDVELSNLKMTATVWEDTVSGDWLFRYYGTDFTEQSVAITMHNDNMTNSNVVIFTIPDYVLYIVKDSSDIKQNGIMYRDVPVKNINEDNVNDKLKDPFSKPDVTTLYRMFSTIHDDDGTITRLVKIFLPENSILYRYNITFLRQSRDIIVDILEPNNQVNCDLHDVIHNDIVIKAVELAIGSIGSQKIQIASNNTQKNIN